MDLSEKNIIEALHAAGCRVTQSRRAVVRALLEQNELMNPQQIHHQARRHHPPVGLVTVYRTLDVLVELGYARRIHVEDGCHGFAPANHGHRHHIVCRRCGAAVEVEGCDLSAFMKRAALETGFHIDDHLLELVGLCPDCV